MNSPRWDIDRFHLESEDTKVIVDLPSGESVEITFDGVDPRVVLVAMDGCETQLVPM